MVKIEIWTNAVVLRILGFCVSRIYRNFCTKSSQWSRTKKVCL